MTAAMRSDCLTHGAVSRPTRRMRSIIFDTAVNDLGKQNILLRGYELHGASFVELSWRRPISGADGRGSIELRVPTLDVSKMVDHSEHLRRSIADRPLEARCIAETERRERMLELADARIAVSFDDGFVEYGGRRSPFHEIELRLVEGPERHLWRLAAELARGAPIRCLPMSAAQLALAEIAAHGPAPVKSRRVTLDADATLNEAVVVMLGSCLDQFLANWPALVHSPHPEEAIHQMRVALRRLRACIGLLRRGGVAGEMLETASARAEEIAATLGHARDLDVLTEMLGEGALAQMSGDPSFYALLDAVECRRAASHRAAQALVAAPETTQFVLDLRAALAARDWSAADDAHALDPAAPDSARDFATLSLERLHRKAMKKSRDLAKRTPIQRHAARIAFKKARYAAELFESLFGSRTFKSRARARKYLRGAAKAQDALGAANDMSVATDLLREIGENSKSAAPASAFAVGWCAHARDGDASGWKETEKELKKLEPFWR